MTHSVSTSMAWSPARSLNDPDMVLSPNHPATGIAAVTGRSVPRVPAYYCRISVSRVPTGLEPTVSELVDRMALREQSTGVTSAIWNAICMADSSVVSLHLIPSNSRSWKTGFVNSILARRVCDGSL